MRGQHKAFELYQGGMFQLIKANMTKPLEQFEILIVSAKHGLLSAEALVKDYDDKMPSDINVWSAQHSKQVTKTLKSVSSKNTDLYVVLPNNYRDAFEGALPHKYRNWFCKTYVSRNNQGIGVMRGRLNKIIQTTLNSEQKVEPIIYRSGICNLSELGYLSAGQAIGSNLAYAHVNSNLLKCIIDAAKTGTKVFLDNGIISGKGRLNTKEVIDQYMAIAKAVPPRFSKNIAIVIPDSFHSLEEAKSILIEHNRNLNYLSKRFDLILPVHRCSIDGINELLAEAPRNIRLGIPCLETKEFDLCLSLIDIERLFSLKNAAGKAIFHKCHFFGLSDASSRRKLQDRLMLAQIYKVSASMDATRTCALFGANSSNRKGSVRAREVARKHTSETVTKLDKEKILNSKSYKEHSLRCEYSCSNINAEPLLSDIYNLINEYDIDRFWGQFNTLLAKTPFVIPDIETYQLEDKLNIAWDLTSQPAVEHALFEKLKIINYENFAFLVASETALAPDYIRFKAISGLFSDTPVPVQMPLQLT
nr:DUF6884 domain-containing protein [Photobacterium angustum]